MEVNKSIRKMGRRVLGPRLTGSVRRVFIPGVSKLPEYQLQLEGRIALEIGGPSENFGEDGFLPVYRVLERVDNCLYSAQTVWTGVVQGGKTFQYHFEKEKGFQFICDATDLKPIPPASYGCVLASHCLEHVANPLRALHEWRAALKPDGFLLLILPHKDGTFDWRRPATIMSHTLQDWENNVGEDDLTHLSEILALHDLSKERPPVSPEQFRQRGMENSVHRTLHHHVFDTPTAVAMIDQAGFEIVRVDTVKPCHIVILARNCISRPCNDEFLSAYADCRRLSPFPSDRNPGEQRQR
jgi:SAM-dependent methyltransferase